MNARDSSSIFAMNRKILAALETVVELPKNVTKLTLTISITDVPRIEAQYLVRSAERFVDVTTMGSSTKEYVLTEREP